MGETYHPRGELVHGYFVKEHPTYNVWSSMKERCNNPDCPAWKNYGGRGIGYSHDWKDFVNFALDMGLPPQPGLTIERVDNDKGYSKENCVWADRFQQARNRRKYTSNTSGVVGVDSAAGGFKARYGDHGTRFNLGNFDTIEEAAAVRARFVELYDAGDPAHLDMVVDPGDRRLRRDSSTGRKGITAHTKGGFLVRKTVKGERHYLGYATTMAKAVAIWDAAA